MTVCCNCRRFQAITQWSTTWKCEQKNGICYVVRTYDCKIMIWNIITSFCCTVHELCFITYKFETFCGPSSRDMLKQLAKQPINAFCNQKVSQFLVQLALPFNMIMLPAFRKKIATNRRWYRGIFDTYICTCYNYFNLFFTSILT